jgi:hypothetical protein
VGGGSERIERLDKQPPPISPGRTSDENPDPALRILETPDQG